jgi:predicted PurR-regulated permease PerM
VGLVIFGIFVLRLSRELLPALVIAALIAVITRPVITWLNLRGRLPRGLAVVVVHLSVFIFFPLVLLIAVPTIVTAVNYVLSLDYSRLLLGVLEWLRAELGIIRGARLPVGTLDAYVDQIVTELLTSLQSSTPSAPPQTPSLATVLRSLGTALTTTFSTVTSLVGAVVSRLVLFIFIFLASIYMNLRSHTYLEAFLRALPPAYRPEINTMLGRIGRMWGAFFRGELTLMFVIGVFSWLGLTVLGIPGALYLGIIAGLLELIPNVGPVIATIPAVIVALLQGSSYLPVSHLTMALIVIGFYVLLQQVENSVIVPWVLGGAVELPPLVVMTGVLVGATAFGLLGALLATPVIATAREILRYIHAKMLGRDPFPEDLAALQQETPSSSGLRQRLRRWAERFTRSRAPAQQQPMPDTTPPPSSDPEGEVFPDHK